MLLHFQFCAVVLGLLLLPLLLAAACKDAVTTVGLLPGLHCKCSSSGSTIAGQLPLITDVQTLGKKTLQHCAVLCCFALKNC